LGVNILIWTAIFIGAAIVVFIYKNKFVKNQKMLINKKIYFLFMYRLDKQSVFEFVI
jgi:hypothetical protein